MKSQDILERKQKLITSNKKAGHLYEIVYSLEAGIVLKGTEVKSLREGKCSIQDSYAGFPNSVTNELFLMNFHISPYSHGNRENHEPKRMRKLLVTSREARKMKVAVSEKGLTIIPLSIYFSGPFVKVELGLVRAKRKYDKREATKERETNRDIQKQFKY